jgi:hypothetical protein
VKPGLHTLRPSSSRHADSKRSRRKSLIAIVALLAFIVLDVVVLIHQGRGGPSVTVGLGAAANPASATTAASPAATAASPAGAAQASSMASMAGMPAAGAVTLLSQSMPATASSTQDPTYLPASAAFDGDPGTRWASASSDPQWLQVDLIATDKITRIVLDWEAAYAKAFQIQTSLNGQTWTTVYSTTSGTGGIQTLNVSGTGRYVRMYGTARATQYGYSLWEFQVFGVAGPMPKLPGTPPMVVSPFGPNLDPGQSVTVSPPVQGITPDQNFVYPSYVSHYEFQTDCSVVKDEQIDPIDNPRVARSSHMHTFLGATTINPDSTTDSVMNGGTTCVIPQDHSAYWFPALYNGNTLINPIGPQVIYYKSGIYDYRTVQPFPRGLRFLVGNPMANVAQFEQSRGTVEGWECGNSYFNFTFPKSCPPGSELVIRYQAPSCWDGVHLDVPGHQSNMAYPIHIDGKLACPPGYPVAVPMLEFKIAFPVSGDLSHLRLSSGPDSTWHYDFFDGWDPTVLAALVKHCINQGLQCDTHGFDQYAPQFGAVLGPNYQLLPGQD